MKSLSLTEKTEVGAVPVLIQEGGDVVNHPDQIWNVCLEVKSLHMHNPIWLRYWPPTDYLQSDLDYKQDHMGWRD